MIRGTRCSTRGARAATSAEVPAKNCFLNCFFKLLLIYRGFMRLHCLFRGLTAPIFLICFFLNQFFLELIIPFVCRVVIRLHRRRLLVTASPTFRGLIRGAFARLSCDLLLLCFRLFWGLLMPSGIFWRRPCLLACLIQF